MAKKHKRHHAEHIETETEIIDETITKSSISEQILIENKIASETHEQIIKTVSLEVAPEHTESLVLDEKSLPMDTESGPKPIEILPLFHASNIQTVSVNENETHIHSIQSPTQRCLVNISEINPLLISEVDKTEIVEARQPDKTTTSVQLSSTLVTSSATISDQVIAYDNLNVLEKRPMPITKIAETSSILHESKTIIEHVLIQKEDNLSTVYAPDLKQATESIDTQNPIEIQEIAAGEFEKDILGVYKPVTQSAICSVISNTALNTQEILAENASTKFYPETFIATEEATSKYIEQIPYQTQEVCTTETGKILDIQGVTDQRQAHIEFSSLQAISTELTEVSESESISNYAISSDLLSTAKDTFNLYRERQTGYSQAIETALPTEPITFGVKRASVSIEEMDGKLIETVNVFQSEKILDITKPSIEQSATPNYVSQKGITVSETLAQEKDTEFSSIKPTYAKASESHEVYKIAEQSDEQLLDVTDHFHHKQMDETFNAQVNYELQKSIVQRTTLTHDSEESFHTKVQTTQPHYSFDSTVNSPIIISEIQTQENNVNMSIEPTNELKALTSHELYKTYEQQNEQMFDTTSEYRGDSTNQGFKAQLNFELQKSTISESVLAHDLEQIFETKSKSNEPHYTFESNVKSPLLITETQIQESDTKFSPERTPLTSATATHELITVAPESSENQMLETVNVYKRKGKKPTANAQINFELRKSMIGETVLIHDTEQTFETKRQNTQPEYTLASNVKSSIAVSEMQIVDSESEPNEMQQLKVTETPKQLSQAGTVIETIPYDSAEFTQTTLEKCVSAKQEPYLHHEIAVEILTMSENIDELEKQKLAEQKIATPGVTQKNALTITEEETVEALDKFDTAILQKQKPNYKSELLPVNPIIVDETKTLEQTSRFDVDTFKTTTASLSTTKHEVVHVDENWPMETLGDFKQTAVVTDQSSVGTFTVSSALQASTVITMDNFEALEIPLDQKIQPKISLDELKGIIMVDVIPQENVDQTKFTLTQELAHGHITQDVEEQRRCEQLQESSFESATLFKSSREQPIQSTENISDALTTAKVEEVIPSLCEKTFEHIKPNEYHGKLIQEIPNVIGLSMQNVPLESEATLMSDLNVKKEYPKKSIESTSYYATGEVELFEKETDLKAEQFKEKYTAKTSNEEYLTVANTSVDTALLGVQLDNNEVTEIHTKTATSKLDRLHEGVNTQDILIHEMPSNVITTEAKMSAAKSSIEYKKSVQIERTETLEKEASLDRALYVKRKCDQSHEKYHKTATSEINQTMEQTGTRTDYRAESKTAKEIASETDQITTFESVYLQEHKDLNQIAQITSETPTQAVNIIEQLPLHKETIFNDDRTEHLLIKPIIRTQEKIELNSAHKQSEINTIVDIKKNKKVKKITNTNFNKKPIEKAQAAEEEGRYNNQTQTLSFLSFQEQ